MMSSKKEGISRAEIICIILTVALIALIIAVILLWSSIGELKKSYTSLQNEISKERKVYFREQKSETSKVKDLPAYCTEICEKERYDGYESSELVHEGALLIYECKCYMIVR
jgi:hypothetical protein